AFAPIVVAFIAAALLALVLTPVVRRLVLRYGMVDHPEDRRVNTEPIPRGGGIAVATAFIAVAVIFLAAFGEAWLAPFQLDLVLRSTLTSQLVALLVGGAAAA